MPLPDPQELRRCALCHQHSYYYKSFPANRKEAKQREWVASQVPPGAVDAVLEEMRELKLKKLNPRWCIVHFNEATFPDGDPVDPVSIYVLFLNRLSHRRFHNNLLLRRRSLLLHCKPLLPMFE